MLQEILTVGFFTAFLSAAVRLAMPLMYGGLGEMIAERAGILNIGMEGVMLSGAFFSFAGAWYFHSIPMGLLCGMLGGMVVSLLHGLLTIRLAKDQSVSGLALNMLMLGVTSFLYKLVSSGQSYQQVETLPSLPIPGLSQIPVLGEGLFNHNVLVYLGVVIALVMWWYLNRTNPGLRLRAVGENPGAADSVGVNILLYKYVHLILGSGIMGLGGFYMALNMGGSFEGSNCWINGYGWIAIALVIFANWNPLYAILGTLVFGFFNTLQIYSGSLAGAFPDALGWLNSIPSHLFKALPFLITAIVLVVTSIRKREGSGQPAALGLNYFREER